MQNNDLQLVKYKSIGHTGFRIVNREELKRLQEVFPTLKSIDEKRKNLDEQSKLIIFDNE
jgi:hypothetical protein